MLQISHRNLFVAKRLLGDKDTTSASGSGLPGRFLFFFGAGAGAVAGFVEAEDCWEYRVPVSFLVLEEGLISPDTEVKLDIFSSTIIPFMMMMMISSILN